MEEREVDCVACFPALGESATLSPGERIRRTVGGFAGCRLGVDGTSGLDCFHSVYTLNQSIPTSGSLLKWEQTCSYIPCGTSACDYDK